MGWSLDCLAQYIVSGEIVGGVGSPRSGEECYPRAIQVVSSVLLIVFIVRVTNHAMRKLYQGEIECELTCANKLEAKKTVSFHQKMIMLAANVPEARGARFHGPLSPSFRSSCESIADVR